MISYKTMMRIGLGALFLSMIPMAEGAVAGKTFFTATFQWNNGSSNSANSANSNKALRLVISKNKKPGFNDPKLVAKIMDGQRIEAICSVQSLETYRAGKSLLASSVDMSCKGTTLGALAAPATVFFRNVNSKSTSRGAAVLRFGTWLQGYQQAVLTTEFDQSARLIQEMPRPTVTPVKLARAQ